MWKKAIKQLWELLCSIFRGAFDPDERWVPMSKEIQEIMSYDDLSHRFTAASAKATSEHRPLQVIFKGITRTYVTGKLDYHNRKPPLILNLDEPEI